MLSNNSSRQELNKEILTQPTLETLEECLQEVSLQLQEENKRGLMAKTAELLTETSLRS